MKYIVNPFTQRFDAVGPSVTGPPGPKGDKGDTGAVGSPGPEGQDGEPGDLGPPGPAGPQGSQGSPGTPGAAGAAGTAGPPGADGADGEDSFIPGPQGATGATGATGSTGAQGPVGPPGLDGEPGADGAPGPPGAQGTAGATGATGPAGLMGMAGLDGEDGADSFVPGPAGPRGLTGLMGPPGLDGDMTADEPMLAILGKTASGFGVPTRIAWWLSPTELSSDAALFWDNVNKRLGVGLGASSVLSDVYIRNNGSTGLTVETFGGSPAFTFSQAGGTFAAPSATTSGLSIGDFLWEGRDSAGSVAIAAGISAVADENWTSTGHGNHMTFSTVPVGGTGFAERARIGANGNVGIGGTSLTALFNVGASDQFQVDSTGQVTAKGSMHLFGTAGTITVLSIGQGTTGTDGATLTIRAGNSGATTATFALNRNGTDFVSLKYGGANTLFEYAGDFRFVAGIGGTERMRLTAAGGLGLGIATDPGAGNEALLGKVTTYNNIATAGWGVPAIYGSGRSTAQTAAVATVATYTVGAADGSFVVSANVLVTTSTTHNFNVQVAYTDEGNTARTLNLSFSQLAGGTFVAAITNVTGAGPYEGVPLHIRAKASTAITIKTAGTFTAVTYNVEGVIKQHA